MILAVSSVKFVSPPLGAETKHRHLAIFFITSMISFTSKPLIAPLLIFSATSSKSPRKSLLPLVDAETASRSSSGNEPCMIFFSTRTLFACSESIGQNCQDRSPSIITLYSLLTAMRSEMSDRK